MIHLWSSFGQVNGWGSLAHGFAPALDRLETVVALDWSRRVESDPAVGIGLGPWQCMPRTRGQRRIASVIGETSRIPAELLRFVRDADQVWVPTEWGRDVLVHSGLARRRVRVVPYGVDTNRFVPSAESPDRTRPFRFLCVGKWERRKGQEELVRAFCRAFDPAAPVELYLHCHNPYRPGLDLESLVRGLVAREGGGPPIHLGPPRSDDQLVRLYQSADAFVLPTRGEGWGLPILEAMACGLPVLVTDHPAVRTFANPPHAYLIRAGSAPVDDPMYFDPDLNWGEWFKPDPDHLVDLLRQAFEDRTTLGPAGHAARREALHWTWDAAAQTAHREIENLRGDLNDLETQEMNPQIRPVEERRCA